MRPDMDVLETHIQPDSPEFSSNRVAMERLVEELREARARAREGGGPKYLERHREQGKLPVRERIERLLDPGSPFLELSPLAAHGTCTTTRRPGAGLVTGIGRVSGREVMVVANDATVKGGTYYPTDREEAPARAGGGARRTGCPASTSSIRAARSCRCRPRSSRIAITSAASSSTRRACRPKAFRRSRW